MADLKGTCPDGTPFRVVRNHYDAGNSIWNKRGQKWREVTKESHPNLAFKSERFYALENPEAPQKTASEIIAEEGAKIAQEVFHDTKGIAELIQEDEENLKSIEPNITVSEPSDAVTYVHVGNFVMPNNELVDAIDRTYALIHQSTERRSEESLVIHLDALLKEQQHRAEGGR